MAREYPLSVYVVLFLIFFNAGAVMLSTFGVDTYLGIDPDTGDTSALETAQDQDTFETGTGQGQTLLGTYNRLASFFNAIVNAVNPGAEMLKSAGMPSGLVNFIFAGLSLIPIVDLAMFVRSG